MTDTEINPAENNEQAPNKRVKYTQGMLLTAQDFQQEQDYFKGKDALANRLLHGYGTVCGLKVQAEVVGRTDVIIHVERGYALSPAGDWIWLEAPLTAQLNEWVESNRESAPNFIFPGENRLFVTLCYEEVAVDQSPVINDTLSDDLDSQVPSRILETANVKFAWDPPGHLIDLVAAQFGSLIKATVRTEDRRQDDSARFLALAESLGPETAELGANIVEGKLFLWQETADQTIQEALVIFVTEVCPRLQEIEEQRVLLARIDFYTNRLGHLVPRTVRVNNNVRPILLPTRLHKELFFRP
jgi:hypothetical protein